MRQFFSSALRFWRGKTALRAWTLTIVVLCFAAAQIATAVGINAWNRLFFDALEKKDLAAVWQAVGWLPILVAVSAFVVSGLVISRMLLQTRWREFLTRRMAGWWIADQRYYRLQFIDKQQSAPEYRIADDVRLSIEPLVEFAIGLLSAAVTAATFATILWQVAGSASFTLGGVAVVIPSYMAVAAIAYAIIASSAAYFAGRPLVAKIAAKNEAEAQFRAEMTRLRENAESVALIKGDADERLSVGNNYGRVVSSWLKVIRQQGVIAIVLNTNGALFPIVPLLLIAPKYLSGEVTLGAVMQVVAAFSAVQAALIWFVDNFVRLAEWFASVKRVDELSEALEALDVGSLLEGDSRIQFADSEDDAIHIENVNLAHSNGTTVIADASTSIAAGEKVLIVGESGTGKSTLIRALAGFGGPGGQERFDFRSAAPWRSCRRSPTCRSARLEPSCFTPKPTPESQTERSMPRSSAVAWDIWRNGLTRPTHGIGSCRAVSANASPSCVSCSRSPTSSSWTKPRLHSTRTARHRCLACSRTSSADRRSSA